MSNCIAQKLLKSGKTVLYQTAPVLLESVIDYKMSKQKNLNDNIYQSVLNVDLLIIDDLGTEYKNQYTVACLYNIINTRILQKKPTIISTNYDFDKFNEIYDMRITSRIAGEYSTLILEGNDIRYIK